MADKFITHNTQLKKLRDKGLIVPSRAKRILESESYHAVINGYREPFVATTYPEFMFLPGTHFDEVYQLYEFDRDLRNLYMKKMLKIEQSIRSSVAYHFSKANRNNNRAYLDFRNFDHNRNKKYIEVGTTLKQKWIGTDVHNVIATLSKKMSNPHNEVIKHYITEHLSVPLWIIVNTLTMGELLYLYLFLKPDQRDAVANDFNATDNELQWFLEQLKIYRNKCAHDERFYCYKQSWGMTDLFHLHNKMKTFLRPQDAKSLESKLNKLFSKYDNKFLTIPFSNILLDMGFPPTYIY